MDSGCVLEGEKVSLWPVEEGDLLDSLTWLNDMEVKRYPAVIS